MHLWTNDSKGNKKCNNELQYSSLLLPAVEVFSLLTSSFIVRVNRQVALKISSFSLHFYVVIFGRNCNYVHSVVVVVPPQWIFPLLISRDTLLAVLNSSRNNSSGKSLCSFRMPNKSGQKLAKNPPRTKAQQDDDPTM